MAFKLEHLRSLTDHLGKDVAEELDKLHSAVFGKPEEEGEVTPE